MIGPILKMIASNVLEDNLEELTKVFRKGGTFEANTGIVGKGITDGINKLFGKKFESNLGIKFTVDAAKRNLGGKAAAMAVGALGKFMFSPGWIAARMTAGMIFDHAKDKQDENMMNNIMTMPKEDDLYKLDQRFNMTQQSNMAGMEQLHYSINSILSQGNLAGDMLERAIGKI